jgi:hypothetical protein
MLGMNYAWMQIKYNTDPYHIYSNHGYMNNVYANKSVDVKNTQHIYMSKSSEDIQVQYDMHLQGASTPMDGDENFIAQEKTSRSLKLR